jgi:hypothetical protein
MNMKEGESNEMILIFFGLVVSLYGSEVARGVGEPPGERWPHHGQTDRRTPPSTNLYYIRSVCVYLSVPSDI